MSEDLQRIDPEPVGTAARTGGEPPPRESGGTLVRSGGDRWWHDEPASITCPGGPDPSSAAASELRRAQWSAPHYPRADLRPGPDPTCCRCRGQAADCPLHDEDWRLCPNAG